MRKQSPPRQPSTDASVRRLATTLVQAGYVVRLHDSYPVVRNIHRQPIKGMPLPD